MSSLTTEQFQKAREQFLTKKDVKEATAVLNKITTLINELAHDFNALNGGELAEYQMKLSGYKFYLADNVADLMNRSKYTDAYIKDYKAHNWNRISDEIKEIEGKVKNKELIENVLLQELKQDINDQIFYETEYQRAKLKSFAVDDILTAIVQRLAELKRQVEQSKQI